MLILEACLCEVEVCMDPILGHERGIDKEIS